MKTFITLFACLLIKHTHSITPTAFRNHLISFGGIDTDTTVTTTVSQVEQLLTELGEDFTPPLTLDNAVQQQQQQQQQQQESHQPQQIHLALTADPRQMRVTFATLTSQTNTTTHTLSLSDGRNFTGTPYTYKIPSRWWQPNGWTGQLYTIVINNLEFNQPYSYYITTTTSNQSPTTSNTYTFKAIDPNQTKISFATYGDMGTVMPLGFKVFDKVLQEHAREPFDFVLHQGDISYAGVDTSIPILNITKNDEWEYIWDLFGRQIEPIASNIPYMTGVGNHEAWYNFTSFKARYVMPYPTNNNSFWFSFDVGPVHVISASSEHDLSKNSSQYQWLVHELQQSKAMKKNNNTTAGKWIVFAIHRPFYCSDENSLAAHVPGSYRIQMLEELLLEAEVDVVVTGHYHGYERVHPNVNGTVTDMPNEKNEYVNPKGPVHLMIGSSGAFQNEKWLVSQPEWSAKRFSYGPHMIGNSSGVDTNGKMTDTYGFGRVDVEDVEKLTFTFVSVTGTKYNDTFSIVRK